MNCIIKMPLSLMIRKLLAFWNKSHIIFLSISRNSPQLKPCNCLAARGQSCTSSVESSSGETRGKERKGQAHEQTSTLALYHSLLAVRSASPERPGTSAELRDVVTHCHCLRVWEQLCLFESLCLALLRTFETSLPSVATLIFLY